MQCPEAQNRLSAYLDRELDPGLSRELALHLDDCPACRNQLESLSSLTAMLAADVIPEPPAALAGRILAASRRPHAASPVILWWSELSRAMRAAAVIMLMVGTTAGTLLGLSVTRTPLPVTVATAEETDPIAQLGLDYFSEMPEGSLAAAYLSLSAADAEGGK